MLTDGERSNPKTASTGRMYSDAAASVSKAASAVGNATSTSNDDSSPDASSLMNPRPSGAPFDIPFPSRVDCVGTRLKPLDDMSTSPKQGRAAAFERLPDVSHGGLGDLSDPGVLDACIDDSLLDLTPCLIHPDALDCHCQGFDTQPRFTSDLGGQLDSLDEPDYSKFENWIPQFVRPKKACDYCRSRRLECYLQRGQTGCTPCNSLFRECSLTNSHTFMTSNHLDGQNAAFLDTLHVVDENIVKDQGALTGIKPLNSKSRVGGTSSSHAWEDAPSSTKRNGIRFPRHAIKTLRDWLASHAAHPYPTEEEKLELERQTELKPMQIANWLANARRRRKANEEKARPRVMQSPSLQPSTPAITIPRADKPWDELNPFERWKHSPPENEPALMTDIVHAVANSDLPGEQVAASPSSKGGSRPKQKSSSGSALSYRRAASTTSAATSKRSSSRTASSAIFSHTSSNSHGSFGSFGSGLLGKRDHRRRKQPMNTLRGKMSDEKKTRPFQCTFCTDTFKSKYDWTRHEKSLHLSLEKWICAPLGRAVFDPSTGKTMCVYCNAHEPTATHLESHNHSQCMEKGLEARTFYRKDHLRQHLRLVHGCGMMPHMDTWKASVVSINSRCGFCAKRFNVWQDRVDHLAAHFKAGARMSEWKGCRGLDPDVAAQVMDAMPPYLIGMESVSPNPFSATNGSTFRFCSLNKDAEPTFSAEDNATEGMDIRSDGFNSNIKTTCWEILTVRLAKYATEQIQRGVVLTDDLLQQQARRILFDSDDPWNQTAADNPEWLGLFKRAHGLDFIPHTLGGQATHVPEDLEWIGDLGLRLSFPMQPNTDGSQNASNVSLNDPSLFSSNFETNHLGCSTNNSEGANIDGQTSSRLRSCCSSDTSADAMRIYPTQDAAIDFLNDYDSLDMLSEHNKTTPYLPGVMQLSTTATTPATGSSATFGASNPGMSSWRPGEGGLRVNDYTQITDWTNDGGDFFDWSTSTRESSLPSESRGTNMNYDDDIFDLQWDDLGPP